jgi:hypothetical protein
MKRYLPIILLITAVNFCLAQKVKPALNLTKGNTYYLLNNATSTIIQTYNGQQNTINLGLTAKVAFKVLDVMDTVYNMEVTYQALDMKIQMAGNSQEIDSKKKDTSDVPSAMIAGMMNQPFNVLLTKSGKIKSISNIDKLISNIFDKFPQIDSVKKRQFKDQFMQSFGPDAFKSSIEIGTAIFPEVKVGKDDKWIVSLKTKSLGTTNVQMNYQLNEITPDLYLIHGDGTMISEKDSKPSVINGLPMQYNLKGTLLSDIKVDRATGWITEVKLKQAIMGEMQVLDNPKMPGGMSIPMTFNTDVLTTSK